MHSRCCHASLCIAAVAMTSSWFSPEPLKHCKQVIGFTPLQQQNKVFLGSLNCNRRSISGLNLDLVQHPWAHCTCGSAVLAPLPPQALYHGRAEANAGRPGV
eukprot:6210308-Lingulodinium_polyedra.AAC.1